MVEKALANEEIIEEHDTNEEARTLVWYDIPEAEEYEHLSFVYHVLAADQAHGRTLVITAYDPRTQEDRWSDDYKTRID